MATIIIFIIIALCKSVSNAPDDFLGAFMMMLAVFVALCVDLSKNHEISRDRLYILLGFLLRCFFLCVDVFYSNSLSLPNIGAGGDSEVFYRHALIVANGGSSSRGFFVYFSGFILRFFGLSRFCTQLTLMMLSIIALLLANTILTELDIEQTIKERTILLISLLPNAAILSVLFSRESIIVLLITSSIYFLVKWNSIKMDRYYYFAIIFSLFAVPFHSGVISISISYVLIRILYDKNSDTFSIKGGNVLTGVLLVLGLVFIYNRYSDQLFGKFSDVTSLSDIANTNDIGGSSYARYVGNSNSIANMLLYSIPRVVFFILSPLPFQWRGLSDIIAFLFSSVFYLTVIIKTVRYYRSKRTDNKSIITMLIIVACFTVYIFAWGVSNTGTATRHRDKLIIIAGLLYALTSLNAKASSLKYSEAVL